MSIVEKMRELDDSTTAYRHDMTVPSFTRWWYEKQPIEFRLSLTSSGLSLAGDMFSLLSDYEIESLYLQYVIEKGG